MRRLVILFSVILLLASCGKKKKLPDGILARDKMASVLWDMVEAGEYLNGYLLYRDTSIKAVPESQKWYAKIYAIHHISKADFDRSYQYYREHPLLMKEVLDSLSKQKAAPLPPVVNHPTSLTNDTSGRPGIIIPEQESLQRREDSIRAREHQPSPISPSQGRRPNPGATTPPPELKAPLKKPIRKRQVHAVVTQ